MTLGNLKALCGFCGLPSIFLTISPAIADSGICINLCNNVNCDYQMEESTHEERSRWTAANPVASAKAFRLIIDTVVQTFIGIPTGNLRRSTFTDIGSSTSFHFWEKRYLVSRCIRTPSTITARFSRSFARLLWNI